MAQSARSASTHLSNRIVPPADSISVSRATRSVPDRRLAKGLARRLARIARRGLAAWLIAGGTVGVIGGGIGGGDAIAHDHPEIASGTTAAAVEVAGQEMVDQKATRQPLGQCSGGQVGASRLPARLDSESMLMQWIESEEAARVACDHALRAEAFDSIAAKRESLVPRFAASPGVETRDASERIADALASFGRLRMLMTRDDFAAKWLPPSAAIDAGDAFLLGATGDVVSGQTESGDVARRLADLACQEPVDVIPPVVPNPAVVSNAAVVKATPPAAVAPTPDPDGVAVAAAEPPRFGEFGMVGSSGIVATMADSYLPYDLSPEDAIAMRMYPISGSPISHLGGRRTGVYAPIDGLAAGTQWHHRIEASTILSTPEASLDATPSQVAVADSAILGEADDNATTAKDAEKMLATIARIAVEAAQPDSLRRQLLAPDRLGTRLGEWASVGWGAVDDSANDLTERFAKALRPEVVESQSDSQLDAVDGRQLVAGATLLTPHSVVSTDWEDVAISDRALRIEIACRAAIDGVIAQASRRSLGGEPSIRQDTLAANSDVAGPDAEIIRAEAVATACDQAAAMLERLAMSLRRAGDSVVRQAKAKPVVGGSIVR